MTARLIFVAALAGSLSTPASATQWSVDHAKSRVGFTVQWSGEPFVATFRSWDADILFDPTDLAHAKVTVSIDLGSETSQFPDNDEGLKGPEGFAIVQFPTAKFETTGFTAQGSNRFVAAGRLSIHGVSRTITLPFTLSFSGSVVHMTGRTVVMRTDFGLGQGEWASPATIAHEVAITVDLTAIKVR